MSSTLPALTFSGTNPEELALDHIVDVVPLTGAASVQIPVRLTPGRAGFGPQLALHYDSTAGNTPFGFGWSLSGLLSIAINTRRSLPTYTDQDSYFFTGSGELVPAGGELRDAGDFWVRYFLARVETSHIRVEQWTHKSTSRMHWRTRDTQDVVTIYGLERLARIVDPAANPETDLRTFAWLPEAQYDRSGNAIFYEYAAENLEGIDSSSTFEQPRSVGGGVTAQRYLKRIQYGNTAPLQPDSPIPVDNRWLFEVVFDYGDHDDTGLPTPAPERPWPARPDPFSAYGSGFEIRTHRLCRRILLFHRFNDLGPDPVLVSIHRLNHELDPVGARLNALQFIGVRTEGESGAINQRAVPPLRFAYSSPTVAPAFQPVPVETTENVPSGLSGPSYRWIDLYGEGLPGILTETGQAWYFKPNEGEGRYGTQRPVVERPAYRLGQCALGDFDNDGNTNLVVLHGREGGFYEFNRETQSWTAFRPFAALPHIEAAGVKAQWIDLNGDGRADLIQADSAQLTWFPSLGKEGFGSAVDITQPQPAAGAISPPLGEDASLGFTFADMTGDGLLDQVWLRNGRVEYWPHLGHGRFGAPVLLDNAPVFAPDTEFDANRLFLVDLDGNGTADIVYVGVGEIRSWLNAQGNHLVEGPALSNLPYIDTNSTLHLLDFLGDGTPCLVWSTPGGMPANSIHYLPLTNGVTPGLLLSVDNSMGRETRLTYSTSASHYLRDQHSGRPWRTRLPRHTAVVDVLEVVDQIGSSRAVKRFEYHDGAFDGPEQTFRGFGLVDQYDTETRTDGDLRSGGTTPSCLRTWFHPGKAVVAALADRYLGDPQQAFLPPHSFENVSELATGEYDDALRALAGLVVRQELFSVTADGVLADHPIETTQSSYRLRRLQAAQPGVRASFTFHLREQITSDYEQRLDDPRVAHDLQLDVDRFGNVSLECTVAYPRRSTIPTTADAQQRLLIVASANRFANVEEMGRYEVGIPVESREFEVNGLAVGTSGLIEAGDAVGTLSAATADPLAHDGDFTGVGVEARLIGWDQFYYWNDVADAALPLGSIGAGTLIHHQESACFTPAFIDQVFGTRLDTDLIEGAGGYREHDGYWWRPGATHHFADAAGFFQLARVERPDGAVTTFTHDAESLAVIGIEDAVGNRISGEIDYHLIAPHRMTDPNENVAEVRYDPLGVIVLSTAYGQVLDSAGQPQPYGQDPLSAYSPPPEATFDTVLSEPGAYLQNAAQFVYYELDAWRTAATPPRVVTLLREELAHDGTSEATAASRVQVAVAHIDGFGRTLQGKTAVESGPAPQRNADGSLVLDDEGRPVEAEATERWLVSGHTVYNEKQQPVRWYEPFFSTTAHYEPEAALAAFGVSHDFHYDAAGRMDREDLPNGSFTRTEFGAWEVREYDPNDTVNDSAYRAQREGLPQADPEHQTLLKAMEHADTPTISSLDPLGREIKKTERPPDAAAGDRVTETVLDLRGALTSLIDPRGLAAFTNTLDMQGRPLFSHSIDAGDTWIFFDIHDRPIHLWDARGVHQHRTFDALDRPVSVFVDGALGLRHLTEKLIYGDDPSIAQAELRNTRGRLALHHDQAGVLTIPQYDFTGQVLQARRQLRADYTSEPDWTDPTTVALEPTIYATRSRFDALGRVRRQSLADGTERHLAYLRGGGLERVSLSSDDGTLTDLVLFEGSRYNARGQRTQALLGNGVQITHSFDAQTFRTNRTTVRRTPTATGQAVALQDLEYTYDPVGNLTFSVDQAQQPAAAGAVIQGLAVSAERDYRYDAFYQLTSATGRVHQALLEHDYRPALATPGVIKGTRHLTLNNGAAVERYTQTYGYDLSGNLTFIRQQGATHSWNTTLWISPTSNRSLPENDPEGNPVTAPESRFDKNGNCVDLPHLRRLDWDYRDQLVRAVIIDRSAAGEPDDAEFYVYDSSGVRIRKVTERLVAGQVEVTEKIYLDDCEIKRIRHGAEPKLERMTSHVADGMHRIALVERWTLDTQARETDDVTKPRVRYQLTDQRGSAVLELDELGAVISYEEYFPYGGSAFIAGDQVREVETKDYRFSGKERDDATGFSYFGQRYYVPWIGRWLSPDPIGPADSINLYQYVLGNPINRIDSDGLQSHEQQRGELRHVPVELMPLVFVPAYLALTPEQRDLYHRNQMLLYRDAKTGLVSLVTPEEANRRIEQSLAEGYNVNRYNQVPKIGHQGSSGEGGGGGGADTGSSADDPAGGVDDGTGEAEEDAGPNESGATGGSEDDGAVDGPDGGKAADSKTSTGVASAPRVGNGAGGAGGRTKGAEGHGGAGTRGTGSGKESGGSGPPLPSWTVPSEGGIPGELGVAGGVSGGVPGGVPGSTNPITDNSVVFRGDGAAASAAGAQGNGRAGGPSSGQAAGAPTGNDARGGRQGRGAPGRDANRPEAGAGGAGLGANGGGSPNGRAGATGTGRRPEQRTALDRAMPVFGYANLEFGKGDPERGGSGGVPGGMGTRSGVGWQLLYAAVAIFSVVTLGGLFKGVLRGLFAGLRRLFTRGIFSRQFWRQAFTRLRRFFWDPRNFRREISPEYWGARGPARGRSLHHWLIPQRARWVPEGLRNAGFNLLELPRLINFRGGLNSWLGFAQRWRGYRKYVAHGIEWGIRFSIPGSIYGSAYGGSVLGEYLWGDQDSEPE
jgi:RHS repeat-associated protein